MHLAEEASQLFSAYISRLGLEVYSGALGDSVASLRVREVSSRVAMVEWHAVCCFGLVSYTASDNWPYLRICWFAAR